MIRRDNDTSVSNSNIIGFDLGHGETALAITNLATQAHPAVLPIDGSDRVLSVVARKADGKVVIGERAIMNSTKTDEIYERFKSNDFSENSTSTRATILFAGKIAEQLKKGNYLSSDFSSYIFIGYPSGWSFASIQEYKSVLEACGLPNVCLVPEARAAFFHAKESGDLHISLSELMKDVLLMDFGSSTADFAITSQLKTTRLDFGNTELGGGLIDGLIMDYTINHSRKSSLIRDAFARMQNRKVQFALRCRSAKERYFNANENDDDIEIEDTIRIEADLLIDIVVNKSIMRNILSTKIPLLNELSWTDALNAYMDHCKEIIPDPSIVIITGGAAKMDFIKSTAEQKFSKSRIVLGKEPSFAIAKGLAYYGRARLKSDAFGKEIDEIVKSDAFRKIVSDAIPLLIDMQVNAVADGLASHGVKPALELWKKSSGQVPTLNNLSSRIADNCKIWIESEDAQYKISNTFVHWFEGIRPNIEKLIEPACDRYHIQKRAMSLAHYSGSNFKQMSDRNHIKVFGGVTAIDGVAQIITAIITVKILLILQVSLFVDPITWSIAILASAISAIFGANFAKEFLQGANIPQILRGVLMSDDKILRITNAAKPKIASQILDSVSKKDEAAAANEKIDNLIVDEISKTLRSQVEHAIMTMQ